MVSLQGQDLVVHPPGCTCSPSIQVAWRTCLLQRKTTSYLQLILLCYRFTITRYPGGFPFEQNPHWFSFQRNCSLDQFTLLPCHTMFWSDLHVHFRSAYPPSRHHTAQQSSHCPYGQSSIPNIQSFTALETCYMLSKGRASCWWMPSIYQMKLWANLVAQQWQMTFIIIDHSHYADPEEPIR